MIFNVQSPLMPCLFRCGRFVPNPGGPTLNKLRGGTKDVLRQKKIRQLACDQCKLETKL